ncbi:hypothetical protein EJB05_55162, partial [Eragrostis curvula]
METLQWILSAGTSFFEAINLSNELDCLRSSLPKARLLINRGEWGMFKDKNLAELLLHLKDTTYDAEDLLRKFEDQMLQQRIEDAGRSRAGQLLSSSLNLAKTFIYRSKKRVKEIQDKLDKVVADVEGALNLMGIQVEPLQLMPETSSVISAPEIFGRDSERDAVIEMLGVTIGREDARDQVIQQMGVPLTRVSTSARSKGKSPAVPNCGGMSTSRSAKRLKGNCSRATLVQTNCTSGKVSVVPIVGIGGVGKTTLAQLIHNDSRVKCHFGVRIWVCVSDFFDKKKITKEIVESISGEEFNGPCSLNALQQELREQLKRRKFLLVLDDIWPNANSQWEEFYAPLRDGLDGSMILITTRYPKVADFITTGNCQPVQLGGLPDDIFWEFFRKCAFGNRDPESYLDLQVIGKSISSRLCGSPLAAKTLGRLLNMDLRKEHWMTVPNSELWQLPHQEYEILPALQLSYLYLPQELKRCFAFCSMFPKDYSFERQEIVDTWVAEGFVALAPEGSMRLEDMGMRYLDDLRSRFLFQADPKFPNQSRYVMHDLIHDMAQSVSLDECFLMQDLSHQSQRTMPHTVRHMSVEVDSECLGRMREIQHLDKLRSLRFGGRLRVEITWFNQLSNILFLSLRYCKLKTLPPSICQLTSLRYLDISDSSIKVLPQTCWCLYSLQVLDANRSALQYVHDDISKLLKLRHLALPGKASEDLSKISGLGNLSCLRNLRYFSVGKQNGRKICELKCMNQLHGALTIRSLCNVRSKEDAAEARLVDKQHLKELYLYWGTGLRHRDSEVAEGLRPHSRVERLKVNGFGGDRFPPSWFKPENLPTLKSLEIAACGWYLKSISIPYLASLEELVLSDVLIECLTAFADGMQAGSTNDYKMRHPSSSNSCSDGIASVAFTSLTALRLFKCRHLKNLEQFLSPENLPSVKSIAIEECGNLVSIPAHRFEGFPCLRDLKVRWCPKIVCPREMVLPPSIRQLSVVDCGELDRSFPVCLENLTSLTFLQLVTCNNVKFIPLSSFTGTNMLKCLVLIDCPELLSVRGSYCLSSIQYADISNCPKLTGVEQPFRKKDLRT